MQLQVRHRLEVLQDPLQTRFPCLIRFILPEQVMRANPITRRLRQDPLGSSLPVQLTTPCRELVDIQEGMKGQAVTACTPRGAAVS